MHAIKYVLVVAAVAMAAPAAGQLTQTQRTNGMIGGSDARDSNGRQYDDFRVSLSAGQRVRVAASRTEGSSLDPYLEIFAPGGNRIAADDDSGGYPNARTEFAAGAAGTYVVRVRSFSSSTGGYDLIVEPVSSRLALQAVNPGSFNNSVPTTANRAHYRDYAINLSAGEEILLRLESGRFDPIIQVFYEGSEGGSPLASDDDGGEGLNSMLLFRAPRAGTYTVRATELSHGDGDYVLRMNRLR